MQTTYTLSEVAKQIVEKHKLTARMNKDLVYSRISSYIKRNNLPVAYETINDKEIKVVDVTIANTLIENILPTKKDIKELNNLKDVMKLLRSKKKIHRQFPQLSKIKNYKGQYIDYHSAITIFNAINVIPTRDLIMALDKLACENDIYFRQTTEKSYTISRVTYKIYQNMYHITDIPKLVKLFKKEIKLGNIKLSEPTKTKTININLTHEQYDKLQSLTNKSLTNDPQKYLQILIDNHLKSF